MSPVVDPGFPLGGGANSRNIRCCKKFPKICIKLIEFGAPGGGGARPKFYYVESATDHGLLLSNNNGHA